MRQTVKKAAGRNPAPPEDRRAGDLGAVLAGVIAQSRLGLLALFPVLLSVLFLACSPVLAADPLVRNFSVDGDAPWKLTADRTVAEHDTEVAEATGHVILSRRDDYIQADFARYYWGTGWLYLRGNIKAKWGGDHMEAEEAEFDLRNNVGWLKKGMIFSADPHLFLRGETLTKTGESTYTFKDLTLTACDGPVPAWSIKAAEGDLTIDGYARIWDPQFQVSEKSVLYSPYMIVPVKTRRQSGFLLPEMAYSSRLGYSVNLPYYHVLDDESDLTFYENLMSERGFMQGIELRFTPDLKSRGYLRFDYMNDLKREATTADEDGQFRNDGLLRPNRDRWWLRGKIDGHLGDPDVRTRLDLDLVSDQNYLREFKNGYSGFQTSRNVMLDQFGRDIAEADSLTRTSTLLVSRSWDFAGAYAKTSWTQNLAYLNSNLPSEKDPSLQTLPELGLSVYKTGLPGTPLEWRLDSSVGYYWREYGDSGKRLDVHPRVSLPMRARGVTFIPELGWRETFYSASTQEAGQVGDSNRDRIVRSLPDVHATLFTEASRVFSLDDSFVPSYANVGESRWTRLRHSIVPRVSYDYIPNIDQTVYAEFDSLDRISPRDELTYSLTNLVTRRRDTVTSRPFEEDESGPILSTDYQDIFILRIEQSYDRREQERTTARAEYPRRPFSDLLVDLTVTPGKYFSIINRTWYSPYLDEITEHEHAIGLTAPNGKGSVYFGLDFMEKIDEFKRKRDRRYSIASMGGIVRLLPSLTASFAYRVDYQTGMDIEKQFALSWQHQCYVIEGLYSQTPDEDRVEARVKLVGLNFFGDDKKGN